MKLLQAQRTPGTPACQGSGGSAWSADIPWSCQCSMRSQQPCVCSGYEWSALAVFCVLVRSSSYNSAWACAAGSFWELLIAWWGLCFQHLASRCWSEVSPFLQPCCLRHFRSWCFSYHPGCSEHTEKKVWGLSELGLRCKMLFQQQKLGQNLTCKWCLWASDTPLWS